MQRKYIVDKTIASLFFLSIMPLAINALIPQVMISLGRDAQSFTLPLSLIVLLTTLMYVVYSRKFIYRSYIFLSTLAFFAYTFTVLFKYIFQDDFSYIITGYSPFFLLYALIVVAMVPKFIDQSISKKFLYVFCSICCVIGIMQYFTNQPIVAISDASGGFKVSSYIYTSTYPYRVRGFSLFNSALEFGYFLIFCLGVFAYKINLNKYFQIIILCLILLATFTTLTRNIYLGLALALVAATCYEKKERLKGVLYIIPFISLGLALLVNLQPAEGSGLSSGSSLQVRQQYWQQEITRQAEATSSSFIFGDGLYQSGDAETGKLFVDNTYLQLIAQYGILGFVLFIIIYFNLLRFSVRSRDSALSAGLYGFLAVWPFIALFNICIYPIGIFTIIALVSKSSKSGE